MTLFDRLRSWPLVLPVGRVAFWGLGAAVLIAAVIPAEDHPPDLFGWDKANHFVAFYALALLGALAFPRRSAVILGAWLSGLGGLIEVLQAIPVLHRDSDIVDWLTDNAGIVAALAPLAAAAWRGGFPRPATPPPDQPPAG